MASGAWEIRLLKSKILARALYEHASRKSFGVMGDYITAVTGATLSKAPSGDLTSAGLFASGCCAVATMGWLISETFDALDYKRVTDSLGRIVIWEPLGKKIGTYNFWDKKIRINSRRVDSKNTGAVKSILAHEYSHMLFDLLPDDKREEIIDDFVSSPNYAALKDVYSLYSDKDDFVFVGEMMAIHGENRRKKKEYINPGYVVVRGSDYICELFDKIVLYNTAIRPIAEKYDHLGFDKPVTAAKAMRKEYMEKLLAAV